MLTKTSTSKTPPTCWDGTGIPPSSPRSTSPDSSGSRLQAKSTAVKFTSLPTGATKIDPWVQWLSRSVATPVTWFTATLVCVLVMNVTRPGYRASPSLSNRRSATLPFENVTEASTNARLPTGPANVCSAVLSAAARSCRRCTASMDRTVTGSTVAVSVMLLELW